MKRAVGHLLGLFALVALLLVTVPSAATAQLSGSVTSTSTTPATTYGVAFKQSPTTSVVSWHAGAGAGHQDRATGSSSRLTTDFVAAETASDASALLGKPGDVVVLRRQADTAIAKGWEGHVVLDTPNWSLDLNDAFIRAAIDQRRTMYLASPTKGNLIQTSGQFAGQPTIYARELDMLRQAGYSRSGDYMMPPS